MDGGSCHDPSLSIRGGQPVGGRRGIEEKSDGLRKFCGVTGCRQQTRGKKIK